jgi:succinate-acetate transporter protein
MAGMWEFACGNTFGALAFTSYGAFWISFAAIFVPWFDIAGAYTDPLELAAALGHYLICIHFPRTSRLTLGWCLFTGFLCVGTLRSSVAFFGLFFTLTMAFLMLAIGYYRGEDENFLKAGGYFGLFTALFAWYNAMAGLWNPGNSYISLPLGQFPWAAKGRRHVGKKRRS